MRWTWGLAVDKLGVVSLAWMAASCLPSTSRALCFSARLWNFSLTGSTLICVFLGVRKGKGIGKVMRIFIRNFTVFLLSNVVGFNGVGNAKHGSVVGSWFDVDDARGCWAR